MILDGIQQGLLASITTCSGRFAFQGQLGLRFVPFSCKNPTGQPLTAGIFT